MAPRLDKRTSNGVMGTNADVPVIPADFGGRKSNGSAESYGWLNSGPNRLPDTVSV